MRIAGSFLYGHAMVQLLLQDLSFSLLLLDDFFQTVLTKLRDRGRFGLGSLAFENDFAILNMLDFTCIRIAVRVYFEERGV